MDIGQAAGNSGGVGAAQLAKWLQSGDVELVARAIDRGLHAEVAVLDELFSGAVWQEVDRFGLVSWAGHRVVLDRSRWTPPDRDVNHHLLSAACLRLLAATDSPLKEMSTIALHFGDETLAGHRLFDDLDWLSEFPNLRRLHLIGNVPPLAYFESLANLPVRELVAVNYGPPVALRSHPTLTTLAGAGVSFERGGEWPSLRQVELDGQWNLDALFQGANRLEHATFRTTLLNALTGGPHQMDHGLTRVSGPQLTNLDVEGNYHVHDCPRLEHLKASGKISITDVPALRDLVLGEVKFEDRNDLWALDSVERMWVDHVSADVITTPPNATKIFVPAKPGHPVKLDVGHRIYNFPFDGVIELEISSLEENDNLLEPLRDAHDLTKLILSGAPTNLEPISKLPNLRSLDITYCPFITDLTVLLDVPWLHSVTVDKTQELVIPAKLRPFVNFVQPYEPPPPLTREERDRVRKGLRR